MPPRNDSDECSMVTRTTCFYAQRNFSLLVQCCRAEAFGRVTRRSEFGSRPRIDLCARSRKHLRLRQRSRPLVQLGPIRFVLLQSERS